MSDLKALFESFAAYGTTRDSTAKEMDGARFVKICKDCNLVDKKFTTTDVDLIFSQVKTKGARKIDYSQFSKALELVAAKKGSSVDDIVSRMNAADGPVTNAVVPDAVKFHDDKSLFTGVHKHGGPTTVDDPKDLSGLTDRSAADVRGVKI